MNEFESLQCEVLAPRKPNTRQFTKPVSSADIEKAMQSAIPEKTQRDTRYCVKIWDEWAEHRVSSTSVVLLPLKALNKSQLQHWMSCFIMEIRKKDGREFPPNSLHHICCGIMRFLRTNGKPERLDFFKDGEFRTVLDSEMKRLQGAGVGSVQKKAELISHKEEELLWQKGFLGADSPKSLVDTMFYMNGVYFALRGGKEHRNLRHRSSQIQLVEKSGERPSLLEILYM